MFYPPHDEEFFPDSQSEPPLKADTSSEPHILLKVSFAIKKKIYGQRTCTRDAVFVPQSLKGELINRRETNFLHGQIVIGEGGMTLNKRGGLD